MIGSKLLRSVKLTQIPKRLSVLKNQQRLFSSFKIYTKTGDKGTSALYTGDRFNKNSNIFNCLGSIDEINANLGLAREFCMTVKNLESSKVHE